MGLRVGGQRETGDAREGGRERARMGGREGGRVEAPHPGVQPAQNRFSFILTVSRDGPNTHPPPPPSRPRLRNTTVILVNFRGGLSTHHDTSDPVSSVFLKST